MTIDKRTFDTTDFQLILDRLEFFCFSRESAEVLKQQPFIDDANVLTQNHQIVEDFIKIYQTEENLFFPLAPIKDLFETLKPQNSLATGESLFRVASFILESNRFCKFLKTERDIFDQRPVAFFSMVPSSLELPVKEILSTFDSKGDILASHPDIKEMQRDKALLNSEMKITTGNFLTANRSFWQEDQAVVRNGRLLLPLKSNFKGQIKGVIHDISASGNTLFIEPLAMMDLNNRMVELEQKERVIRSKWIRHFSRIIHQSLDELLSFYNCIIELDTFSARGRYALCYGCTRVQLGSEILLTGATHPSLGDSAVPINLSLNKNIRLMVISGPNAGGKTVAIKTIALAVLMNQFSLFPHVLEGSVLPLFPSVMAAIGDNQSIEEGASTFSGYMRRVGEILDSLPTGSLILLDELGSGTDPMAGGALAIALLEYLKKIEVYTLVTTHLSDIRNYAESEAMAINASVQFDDTRHLPTYQIDLGIAGESHAVEIAAKNGIPSEVITNAFELLKSRRTESMCLLENLNKRERMLKKWNTQLSELERELNDTKAKSIEKEKELNKRELFIRKESQVELNQFIRESKGEVNILLSKLKKVIKQSSFEGQDSVDEIMKKGEGFFHQIVERTNQEDQNIKKLEKQIIESNNYQFEVGMDVFIGESKQRGTILRKDKKNKWLVLTDSIKMSVVESSLIPDFSGLNSNNKKGKSRFDFICEVSHERAQLILDLRGLTLEEAKSRLHHQIELALLNHLAQFSIIHGLGRGILKEGIQEELSRISSVRSFYYASPEQGGYGRTEVELEV